MEKHSEFHGAQLGLFCYTVVKINKLPPWYNGDVKMV